YMIALYGCAKGGFIAVPANPGMNPKDIAYILNHAEIKALITDDMLCQLVNAIKENLPNVKHFISIQATGQKAEEPYIAFDNFLEGHSDEEVEDIVINDRNIFEILYTSGTTSQPKGVAISHLSVFIASLSTAIEIGIDHGFVANLVLPIFHCAQQTITTSVMHMGGKTVISRGFDPALMLESIEKSRINLVFCLPAMYRAMLDHPRINETDLSSLKKCIYAMAPMDRRTLEQAIETFKADFMLGSGQTECFPPTNVFRPEWQLKKKGNYWGNSCLTLDTAVMDDDG
ncbi:MAG: AMP-binding protein, partial [Desulfobacteraceae bacterium]|nr:AMP-binding protein [Desulfobacteraceae bacterium]